MLRKVANDDVVSYKNNNQWLIHHPQKALIFKDPENVWVELKTIYSGNFKYLVYGEFPEEEAILKSLRTIQERLTTIFWTIELKPNK